MQVRKPRDLVVFNATFEKWEFPIFSRVFTFAPRSKTLIDERYVWPIEKEHFDKGLVVLEEGDDEAAKEKQALMAYRQQLLGRVKNYRVMMDEFKKKGVTLEKPDAMKLAEKWLGEIDKRYSIEAEIMQTENSFLTVEPLPSIKEEKQPTQPIRQLDPVVPFGLENLN